MFDRDYIAAFDLGDDDRTITILSVKAVELQSEQGKNKKPVIKFETDRGKSEKGFVLNKTNAVSIAGMYGTDTKDWIGKRVTLFSTTVEAFGGVQDAIRVRPEVPK